MGIREIVSGASDEHFASEVGGLFRQGAISGSEYDAGAKYGKLILDYLRTIDAPSPYSDGSCEEFPDEVCLGRKIKMAEARAILKKLGNKYLRIVDRVAVYGEPLTADELPVLRAGLRALAGN